jgi:hypothetical protein
MATSQETFNQVKNILRKLDRSIDDIRARRGTPPTAATAVGGPSAAAPLSSAPTGRARPMNRDPRNSF